MTAPLGPLDFEVVNEEELGAYDAIAGGRELGILTYDLAGADRVVLLATSVFPEFRRRGVATELIRRALDDVRAQRKTVTIFCPIVRRFIESNPGYADLVDVQHPGVVRGPIGG